MGKTSTAWLAALVFLVALSVLLSGSVLAYDLASLTRVNDSLTGLLSLASGIAAILFAVVRFWLWRLAAPGRGASLLLAAAIVGVLALAVPLALVAVFAAAYRFFFLAPIVFGVGAAAGPALAVVAALLFALGLLLSDLVPRWVSVVGLLSALASTASLLIAARPSLVASIGAVLQLLFLVALGVSLLRRSHSGVVATPDGDPVAGRTSAST